MAYLVCVCLAALVAVVVAQGPYSGYVHKPVLGNKGIYTVRLQSRSCNVVHHKNITWLTLFKTTTF